MKLWRKIKELVHKFEKTMLTTLKNYSIMRAAILYNAFVEYTYHAWNGIKFLIRILKWGTQNAIFHESGMFNSYP